MSSLTRAITAYLQMVRGIGDQGKIRRVGEYVQSHQNFLSSSTHVMINRFR